MYVTNHQNLLSLLFKSVFFPSNPNIIFPDMFFTLRSVFQWPLGLLLMWLSLKFYRNVQKLEHPKEINFWLLPGPERYDQLVASF